MAEIGESPFRASVSMWLKRDQAARCYRQRPKPLTVTSRQGLFLGRVLASDASDRGLNGPAALLEHRPCGMTLRARRANCKRGIAIASGAKWSDSPAVNESLGLAALGCPDCRDAEQGFIGNFPL